MTAHRSSRFALLPNEALLASASMNQSLQVEQQPPQHHRLGGGTAAVAAVLGLMGVVWALVEATRARITMSSDGIQGQYPCGSVLHHRPACDAAVYSSGTTTTIVAAVLAVVLLTFAALTFAQVVRRRHVPVGVGRHWSGSWSA